MSVSRRRSERIAAIQKEFEIVKAQKAETPASKVTKPKKSRTKTQTIATKVTKPKKSTRETENFKQGSPTVKVDLPKTTKSRSAKKEDAIELGDDYELNVGDEIPSDLEIKLQNGEEQNLLEFSKKAGVLVIFSYPKASTPGCTRQAKGFRDHYKELNEKYGASVLGLSADNAKTQTNFKVKQELQYDLICDTKKELIALLGCKKFPSGIIRSHFIFVDGVLRFKNVKVSPEESFTNALKQVKELSKSK